MTDFALSPESRAAIHIWDWLRRRGMTALDLTVRNGHWLAKFRNLARKAGEPEYHWLRVADLLDESARAEAA